MHPEQPEWSDSRGPQRRNEDAETNGPVYNARDVLQLGVLQNLQLQFAMHFPAVK